ncbi:MAG: asparagine synthase (glutamine-hydrolyzing) [Bacteroidia bacterium]|nr:asparagine synthase (glutamine-hydrolyzing) [Bacteroidia bacterium]
MCGIAGFTFTDHPEDARTRLQAMTDALSHRGPDAAGHLIGSGIALGHRRLSIIDLSDAANQPITDPSGRYTIIYNGEVYNFREVRARLPQYQFQSNSDTDVILAAYMEWGPDCLQHFNGMFAFAVWDAQERSLFLCRDRLGIKPLYYTWENGRLGFASELRALLRGGLAQPRLNREALPEYLRYFTVHAPRTLLAGVQQLRPGTWALLKDGQLDIRPYWSLTEPRVFDPGADYAAVCRQVRGLLTAAVERRLISDVPFGAFLSGGIDSSAVVALMATVSDTPVHTFSVVFDEPQYDESRWSSMIAKRYGTQHHPIRLSPGDFLEELPAALAALDHPSGDGLNSYVVSQATKRTGFTVALSGLGGDELFAGYPVFRRYASLRQRWAAWYGLPAGLRRAVAGLLSRGAAAHKTERLRRLMAAPDGGFGQLYPVFRQVYDDAEIQALTGGPAPANDVLAWALPPGAAAEAERLPLLSQVSAGEIATYTQNVLLRDTDQMSMAHALEVRVPFFDYTLVEYVLSIPDTFKYPHTPKRLLVDALGDLIPAEIVNRPKMGFVFPWAQWLRQELRPLAEQSVAALGQREGFDAASLQRFWRQFQQGDPQIPWMKIWMLAALESWMSRNGIA